MTKPAKMTLFSGRNGGVFEFECTECGISGSAIVCRHFNDEECEHIDFRCEEEKAEDLK